MKDDAGIAARAEAVFRILSAVWPESRPQLRHGDCFELLCAVALSAQCTDEQVNRVTPALFSRWPDAKAMARARVEEVEAVIHSLGFFRTKARHLVEATRILVERHGGAVPGTMEELLELPGVGRKTANLVLSSCFGQPGIIVDTHALRVCYRLGLGQKREPAAMERRIAELVPPDRWTHFSHAVNRHGKFVCTARKPACTPGSGAEPCPLVGLCPRVGLD